MTVCEHVADVAKQVKDYYNQCDNIAELASYAEEIKKIEYVDDVYFSSNTMFVDIKDFGPILYSFFQYYESNDIPADKSEIKALNNIIEGLKTRVTETGSSGYLNTLENAVIINQQHKDESRQWARDAATIAIEALNCCGVKCTPNNEPSMDFFQNELFDYDIIFLITHGVWDPWKKLHWLLTSENPTTEEKEDFDADDLYKYKDFNRDNVTLVYGADELRNNNKEKETIWYVAISEKFIKDAPKDFKKKGNAIFFNVACQSMMGGIPREKDNNEREPSLAVIFNNKGVGFYLGFDEVSHNGAQEGGMLFFAKLASGMSLRAAYESLPQECLHNHLEDSVTVYRKNGNWEVPYKTYKSWIADLQPSPSYENGKMGISNSFLISPVMDNHVDNSSDTDINMVLSATSPLFYDEDYINTLTSWMKNDYLNDFDYSGLRYGFEYSTNENFTDAKKTEGMSVNTTGCSFTNRKVTFTKTLTNHELKSNTTYYYRAYLYDGYDYNYSKPDHFKTRTLRGGSGSETPDVPGSDF